MVTSSANQYITPDLNLPLPYESKESPLVLLALTCSAIGSSDTPNCKLQRRRSSCEKNGAKARHPPPSNNNSAESGKTREKPTLPQQPQPLPPAESKFSFKPYELDAVVTTRSDNNNANRSCNSNESAGTISQKSGGSAFSGKSSRCSPRGIAATSKSSPVDPLWNSECPLSSTAAARTPDYSPAPSFHQPTSIYPYLPSATFGCVGCPSDSPAAPYRNPYLSPAAASCFGCALPACSVAACSPYHAAAATQQSPPSYACSWMATADARCGKKFRSGEELLAHLRAHASAMVASVIAPHGGADPSQSMMRYPPLPIVPPSASAAVYGASVSPSALGRYHPYRVSVPVGPSHPFSLNSSLSSYLSPYPFFYDPLIRTVNTSNGS